MVESRDKVGTTVLSEEELVAKLLSLGEASRQEDEMKNRAKELQSRIIRLRRDITSPIEKIDKENADGETPYDVVNEALWEIYEDPSSLENVKAKIMKVYQANVSR